MPVRSDIELCLYFAYEETLAKRSNRITRRDLNEEVGRITPHYYMMPEGDGVLFQSVLPPSDSRIQILGDELFISPPLEWGEIFKYTTEFRHKLEREGTIYWRLKHPTQNLKIVFSTRNGLALPNNWDTGLMIGNDQLREPDVRVLQSEGRIVFFSNSPPIGSQLQISWS